MSSVSRWELTSRTMPDFKKCSFEYYHILLRLMPLRGIVQVLIRYFCWAWSLVVVKIVTMHGPRNLDGVFTQGGFEDFVNA
jgi:hypothetical protein